MTRRQVVRTVLEGKRPPYVPWHFDFTREARAKLNAHFRTEELDDVLHPHFLPLGLTAGLYEDIGNACVRDVFGVVWDRNADKDIGVVKGRLIPEPTMVGVQLPDPADPRYSENIPAAIARHGDRFRVFNLGFSLYERAWTMRGMECLMMDFIEHPDFVHQLLTAIADHNIARIRKAVTYDIDAVHFGDDWGQQQGLQMGPRLWRKFIYPQLKRMYAVVRQAG